jgi:hypothetical protein
MPNTDITAALAEFNALAPTDNVEFQTLEVRHSSVGGSLFMVQNTEQMTLTLETGIEKVFEPVPFRLIPPASGKDGFSELSIAIDNVDRQISDFIDTIGTDSREPVELVHRIYLLSDTTGPQGTPLVLYLTDLKENAFEVTARASFTGIVNMKFPNEYYDRQRFPSLGG